MASTKFNSLVRSVYLVGKVSNIFVVINNIIQGCGVI